MIESNIQKKLNEFFELESYGNCVDAICLIEDHPEIKSPVEKLFFAIWNYSPNVVGGVSLTPQQKVGSFFVDFEIDFLCYFVNSPIIYSGQELTAINKFLPKYAIEIDGHDFHEKTKQQVSRDKERERIIVSAGYKILRFSGSEVFNDPSKCVSICSQAYVRDFYKCIRKIQYSKDNINGLD